MNLDFLKGILKEKKNLVVGGHKMDVSQILISGLCFQLFYVTSSTALDSLYSLYSAAKLLPMIYIVYAYETGILRRHCGFELSHLNEINALPVSRIKMWTS